MKTITKGLVSIALLAAAFTVGCGSGSGSSDSGVGGSTGSAGAGAGGTGGGDVCAGVTLHGISDGDSCFDVVSVAAGSQDGCMIGVADPFDPTTMSGVVGSALPVNYVANTGVLTVGTSGSLGDGSIMCNQGTLLRDSNTSFSSMPTCTFHQTDTSMVTITATNEFDITITENENMFATACSASNAPAGGSCMSMWTWHMKKNAAKTPPGCN
jgi:hypothetical protein